MGAFTEPAAGPAAGTMPTLNQIMAAAPATNASAAVAGEVLTDKVYWGLTQGAWGTRTGTIATVTLSAANATVAAGYDEATTLTAVDADLAAGNIATNRTIFGVAGTLSTNTGNTYSAAVPKTGQTTLYAANDDGACQKGVALPSPRFTDNGTGTVTDNLTGLIWLKNANGFGARAWTTALTDCATLNSGEIGLTDGSVEGDWRLPNVKELFSLVDLGRTSPSRPSGHLFTDVQSLSYWSSSTVADATHIA